MDRSALQAFNALGSATRRALWPSVIAFAGQTATWNVAMGPLTYGVTQDASGQGFVYYNSVVMEFPRDVPNQTYEPKVGAVFVRKADATSTADTHWVVTKVQQIPNEVDLLVYADRAPK